MRNLKNFIPLIVDTECLWYVGTMKKLFLGALFIWLISGPIWAATCAELLKRIADQTNEFTRLEATIPSFFDFAKHTNDQFKQNQAAKELYEELSDTAVDLKILTFNAGMLDAPVIHVPKFQERLPYLEPALRKDNFDLLSLQEIWPAAEREHLKKFALENDYFYFDGNQQIKKPELVLLIKKEIVAGDIAFEEHIYHAQQWYEPATGYRKSILTARFRLLNGEEVVVANTHLAALSISKKSRARQIAELTDYFKRQHSDFLVLTGDFNTTPFKERGTYWPLMQELQLVDSHLAVHPASDGFTHDTINNLTAHSHLVGGQEEPKRLDYIFYGRNDLDSYYYVKDSQIMFTEDIPIDGQNYKLSDHYGLGSIVSLFSKKK